MKADSGTINDRIRARRESCSKVGQFLCYGILFLLISFISVGSYYQKTLYGGSLAGAIIFSWVAAGLGMYGSARYPSLGMGLLAALAIGAAALSAARFWLLIMPN